MMVGRTERETNTTLTCDKNLNNPVTVTQLLNYTQTKSNETKTGLGTFYAIQTENGLCLLHGFWGMSVGCMYQLISVIYGLY